MTNKREHILNDFAVTLSQSDYDKEHVFQSLSEFCSELVVAEEKHEGGGKHFHCYIKTLEPFRLSDLRDYLIESICIITEQRLPERSGSGAEATRGDSRENTGEVTIFSARKESDTPCDSFQINIQTVKNKKSWLTYITKDDQFVRYQNISSSNFHRNYQIRKYIREHETYNLMDTIFQTNIQYTRIICDMHAAYWSEQIAKGYAEERMCVVPNVETVPWVKDVIQAFEEGKHIYLYGNTGVGKSVLARYLSRHFKPDEVLHMPCGETIYEFSGLTSVIRLVIAEDVGPKYLDIHRQQLLIALDKGILGINVKCKPIAKVRAQAQWIILSNYICGGDLAIRRRLISIEADRDGFQEALRQETVSVSQEVCTADAYETLFASVLSQETSGDAECSEGDSYC